jgi:hypothetical protein
LIGLLVDAAQHDAYPAVRRIAVHALRDRLARDHAGAAAALAGYCATDRATQREAALHRALQDVRFELPDARLAATLRAESSKVAIEIGE